MTTSDERVWMVTGASRGIGAAIARRAAEAGCRVALVARGESVLETASAIGEGAIGIQADVADTASITGAVEQVLERFGRLDVVVNNAGVHRGGKVHRLASEDWQQVIDVNLTGALNAVRASVPHLEPGSSIINIGAVVGLRGFPGDVAYASSKAGLSGMTQALAIELARRDISVNLVIPGLVLTEMTAGLTDAALESMRKIVPAGRFGEADEIAQVVYWVSQSRYMTGATVPVDGGLLSSFGVTGQ